MDTCAFITLPCFNACRVSFVEDMMLFRRGTTNTCAPSLIAVEKHRCSGNFLQPQQRVPLQRQQHFYTQHQQHERQQERHVQRRQPHLQLPQHPHQQHQLSHLQQRPQAQQLPQQEQQPLQQAQNTLFQQELLQQHKRPLPPQQLQQQHERRWWRIRRTGAQSSRVRHLLATEKQKDAQDCGKVMRKPRSPPASAFCTARTHFITNACRTVTGACSRTAICSELDKRRANFACTAPQHSNIPGHRCAHWSSSNGGSSGSSSDTAHNRSSGIANSSGSSSLAGGSSGYVAGSSTSLVCTAIRPKTGHESAVCAALDVLQHIVETVTVNSHNRSNGPSPRSSTTGSFSTSTNRKSSHSSRARKRNSSSIRCGEPSCTGNNSSSSDITCSEGENNTEYNSNRYNSRHSSANGEAGAGPRRSGESSFWGAGSSCNKNSDSHERLSLLRSWAWIGRDRYFSSSSSSHGSAGTSRTSEDICDQSATSSSKNSNSIRVWLSGSNTNSSPSSSSSRAESSSCGHRACSTCAGCNSNDGEFSRTVEGEDGQWPCNPFACFEMRRGSSSSCRKEDGTADNFRLTGSARCTSSSNDRELTKPCSAPVAGGSSHVAAQSSAAATNKTAELHNSNSNGSQRQLQQTGATDCGGEGSNSRGSGQRDHEELSAYKKRKKNRLLSSFSPSSSSPSEKRAEETTVSHDASTRGETTRPSFFSTSAPSVSSFAHSSNPYSSSAASPLSLRSRPSSCAGSSTSSSCSPCSPSFFPERRSLSACAEGPRGYVFDPIPDAPETEPQAVTKLDELAMVQLKTVLLPADLRLRLKQLLLHAGRKKDLERMGRLLMTKYTARTSVELPRVLPSQLFAAARSTREVPAAEKQQDPATAADTAQRREQAGGEGGKEGGGRSGRGGKGLHLSEEALLQQEALALAEDKRHRLFRRIAGSYSPLTAAAYTAHRYAGVYSSLLRILREIKVRAPDFVPEHVLEMHAGFAAGLAAAARVWALPAGDTSGACTSLVSETGDAAAAQETAAERRGRPQKYACAPSPAAVWWAAATGADALPGASACTSQLLPGSASDRNQQQQNSKRQRQLGEPQKSSGTEKKEKQSVFKFLLAVERSPHLTNVGKFLTADLSPPVQWQMGLYEEGLGFLSPPRQEAEAAGAAAAGKGEESPVTAAGTQERKDAKEQGEARAATSPAGQPETAAPRCTVHASRWTAAATTAAATIATATSAATAALVPPGALETSDSAAVEPRSDICCSRLGSIFAASSSPSRTGPKMQAVDRRRFFDLIMLPHCLLSTADGWESMQQQVRSLWNRLARGGVLLLLERGTPTGFRALHAVREMFIRELGVGRFHFIAPCPHESICPLALTGRDWCHFSQRVHRLPHHVYCKGSRAKNVEEEKFSFLAIRKMPGPRTRYACEAECPTPEERSYFWPRLVMPVIKAGRHCLLDLCAAPHAFERVAVSKSMPHTAGYKCARKAAWGDLWRFPRRIIRPDARGYTDEEIRRHLLRLRRTTQNRLQAVTPDSTACNRRGAADTDDFEAELVASFGG